MSIAISFKIFYKSTLCSYFLMALKKIYTLFNVLTQSLKFKILTRTKPLKIIRNFWLQSDIFPPISDLKNSFYKIPVIISMEFIFITIIIWHSMIGDKFFNLLFVYILTFIYIFFMLYIIAYL